jgi:hypothetical protein
MHSSAPEAPAWIQYVIVAAGGVAVFVSTLIGYVRKGKAADRGSGGGGGLGDLRRSADDRAPRPTRSSGSSARCSTKREEASTRVRAGDNQS